MPDDKEPGFFVHGYGINNWDQYLSLFEAGRRHACRGEASAAYLAAPESPAWIQEKLGEIKIVVLLRNPVFRAYSLYCWMVMEGYESAPTFAAALEMENDRAASEEFRRRCPQYFADYLYFGTGLYADQVARYLETFGTQHVQIHLFEDLVNRPQELYASVCRFLEIERREIPSTAARNVSIIPRSIGLQNRLRLAQQRSRRVLHMAAWPVTRTCFALMKCNIALGRRERLDVTLQAQLTDRYRSDLARLAGLIGRDLNIWLKP